MRAAIWIVGVIGAISVFAAIARADAGAGPDRYTLVRCGTLLAVPGKPARAGATIVVKNGVIDSIVDTGTPIALPEGAQKVEVDLSKQYVLPGLIDCHVHLTNQFDPSIRTRAMTESDAFVAVKSTQFLRRTLEAGFTTVRDLGAGEPSVIFALRDAVNQGIIAGPRILSAGHMISITGGHGDPTLGYKPGLLPDPKAEEGVADGAAECMKAVRSMVGKGADVIKVASTGGVLSASTAGLAQHYSDPELEAIVKTAHSLGRKVAAHAHGTDGINAALRAGVDSIEHGTYLDDSSIELFKKTGAYYVPTVIAGVTVAENAKKPGYYLPMIARKAAEVGPRIKGAVERAHKAGVKIAFGTDAGVCEHGINAQEFSLLTGAGLTPSEAIVAATINAADLLGLSDQIGTLEVGKQCDLIAVSGDPIRDVRELERVEVVMRGGMVVGGAP